MAIIRPLPRVLTILLALGLAMPIMHAVAATAAEQARAAQLRHGVALLLQQGQRQAAIDQVFDPLIKEYTRQYAGHDERVYCPRTEQEGLQYLSDAVSEARGHGVILTDLPTWVYAYYYKGYALIDLGRMNEARRAFNQALALAPRNAQLLAELSATYQKEDPARMLMIARQAADASRFSPSDLRDNELGRALRSQGYALIEMARWNEAEQAYRQALKLDPNDQYARAELDYVLSHRTASP